MCGVALVCVEAVWRGGGQVYAPVEADDISGYRRCRAVVGWVEWENGIIWRCQNVGWSGMCALLPDVMGRRDRSNARGRVVCW